jgi:hypothetical protein
VTDATTRRASVRLAAVPRWQPFAVLAALAAPPVALAVLVWPSNASASGGPGTDDVQATLHVGDAVDGDVSGTLTSDYEIVGDGSGPVRVSVVGVDQFDTTLTLVDPDSGDQIDFIDDDGDSLDPALSVDLDDGESAIAEVRSLGGEPGSFTISVASDDGSDGPKDRPVPPIVGGD